MTTIQGRSFAGLVVAHLAVTVVVCGGLVVLLPAPALPQGLPATIAAISATDSDAPADPADHQLTGDDSELSAPDSDDDDDDDDAPAGSDAAMAVDPSRMIARSAAMETVGVEAEPWISRTVDGHSLRGPPRDDETSSDVDDIDGDDDDPTADCSDLLPPATSRATCLLSPARFISASSTRSGDLSLRAPPL